MGGAGAIVHRTVLQRADLQQCSAEHLSLAVADRHARDGIGADQPDLSLFSTTDHYVLPGAVAALVQPVFPAKPVLSI
ncbi:hypothetical protein D3C85_1000970 [compost metagenome]